MAKKQASKASIPKKEFNLNAFKKAKGMDHKVKKKELTWIPMSSAFHTALKLPGIPRGYFTSFRGYSNTGKSTAIYEGVAGAQKIGDLPIIYETEGNWNWEHARNVGVEFEEIVDEETGEVIDYEGNFIFLDSDVLLEMYKCYDYSSSKEGSKELREEVVIEDIARHMTQMLDAQKNEELPRSLAFFWDSVGSINGFKAAMSGAGNNQWNAGSMECAFKSIPGRIAASQKVGKKYTNTFAVVQKIWLDNMNSVIKHKGGEAFFYAPRIIIHFGGILTHSTTKIKATSGGETYQFGIETKVRCEKNQVNGVEQQGKIASTPHGYWDPKKLDDYKKEHRDYILKNLNTELSDFEIKKEESNIDAEREDDDNG